MRSARTGLLWGGAAAVALTGHIALAYAVAALTPERKPPAGQQQLVIDLTPVVIDEAAPVEPDTVEQETAEEVAEAEPVEEIAEAEPETVEETVTEETETPEPETVQEEVIEETEVAEAEPEETVEETPAPKPEVVLPKREPDKPKVERKPKPKVEAKPKPKPKPKVVEAPKKKTVVAAAKPVRKGPAKQGAQQARQSAPRASAGEMNRWGAQVQAAIRRRMSGGKGVGRAVVSFVVTASGGIGSVRLASSSGSSALDSAALAAVRSASVPPPPSGSTTPLRIPIIGR